MSPKLTPAPSVSPISFFLMDVTMMRLFGVSRVVRDCAMSYYCYLIMNLLDVPYLLYSRDYFKGEVDFLIGSCLSYYASCN